MKVTLLKCIQPDYSVLAIECTWKTEPKDAKVKPSVKDAKGLLLGDQNGNTAGMAVFAEKTFQVGKQYTIEVGTMKSTFTLKDNGEFQAICVNAKPLNYLIVFVNGFELFYVQ